ncbi:hypothetical protein AB1N83_010362 [Pleurotus pulmonarius]
MPYHYFALRLWAPAWPSSFECARRATPAQALIPRTSLPLYRSSRPFIDAIFNAPMYMRESTQVFDAPILRSSHTPFLPSSHTPYPVPPILPSSHPPIPSHALTL